MIRISAAILLAVLDVASPFFIPDVHGGSPAFAQSHLRYGHTLRRTLRSNQHCRGTALRFKDTSLDDLTSPEDDDDSERRQVSSYQDDTLFDTSIEDDEAYFEDETPQEKILRLRSGQLTSFEKKAFLESTLKGNQSLRPPVIKRRENGSNNRSGTKSFAIVSLSDPTIVLTLGKTAKVVRENEEYVSRVLDPSRFGLQLARHATTTNTSVSNNDATTSLFNDATVVNDSNNTSLNHQNGTMNIENITTESIPDPPATVGQQSKKEGKPLTKYFSPSKQAKSPKKSPNHRKRGFDNMSARDRPNTIGDAAIGSDMLRNDDTKSKRWGIDMDKIKVSDNNN